MIRLAWIDGGYWQARENHQRLASRRSPCTVLMLALTLLLLCLQLSPAPSRGMHAPDSSQLSPPSQSWPRASALEATCEAADGTASAGDWWLAQIGAPSAWDKVAGSGAAVIAVVDAGIDSSHPDLADQLWANPGEIPDNRLDDDDNGYIDDIHGWNIVDDSADLSDSTGHGTAMAGIIAAARNDRGITGVCPMCRLMIVKVTGVSGQAFYPDIAAGVRYAAKNGADVISISLRGTVNSSILWKAISEASHKAIVVSGAGNDGSTTPVYPGAYDRVLAVAATGKNDTKLESSNHGNWVDVAAPGDELRTCRRGGGYWSRSGTSVAAAVAAGLAGLLRCQHADWSPEQVRVHIMRTADCVNEKKPQNRHQLGSGRINADRALGTAEGVSSTHGCCGLPEQPIRGAG